LRSTAIMPVFLTFGNCPKGQYPAGRFHIIVCRLECRALDAWKVRGRIFQFQAIAGKGQVMINQDWWFTTLLAKQFKHCPPLNQDIRCDVLIVGGGFAGVSAAAEFVKKGSKVV